MEVRRRGHGEADVGAPAPHLCLVVHDDRPAPARHHDLGDRGSLLGVLVVADDRDDVTLLDGEADVDDQRGVLQELGRDNSAHLSPHPLCLEQRQHFLREALHLTELVDRAEPADEVVDASVGERPLEPIQPAVRSVIERAVLEMTSRLYRVPAMHLLTRLAITNTLPVTAEDIKITRANSEITVHVEYTVPIEFPGYTYQWHITHESTNPIF